LSPKAHKSGEGMMRAFVVIMVCAGVACAGSVQTTAQVTGKGLEGGAGSPVVIDCDITLSGSTSVSLPACSGLVFADASADFAVGPLLDGFTEGGRVSTHLPPPYPYGEPGSSARGSATSDGTETESLIALGATGSGILQLNFLLTGQSQTDYGIGGGGFIVSDHFTVNGGGGFCPTFFPTEDFGCGGAYFVPVSIPFIFGVPFSVTQDLNVVAGSIVNTAAGGPTGLALFDIQSVLWSYSVTDPSGSPITGAIVTQTPELAISAQLAFRWRCSSCGLRGGKSSVPGSKVRVEIG
jgi:hypothetical protein